MQLTIFGGTGETGQILLEKALNAGHNVTVYARSPLKIKTKNDKLTVIEGTLTETNNIDKAIIGADVVISLLGPTQDTKDGSVISTGINHIINSMEKNGVKRFIATATPSLKDENDTFQLAFACAVLMIKTFMKPSYQNIVESGALIRKSNLDWTIVRLPMLSNKPTKKQLNVGYVGAGNVSLFSLSRIDLANFLLQQTADSTYLHKSPLISN